MKQLLIKIPKDFTDADNIYSILSELRETLYSAIDVVSRHRPFRFNTTYGGDMFLSIIGILISLNGKDKPITLRHYEANAGRFSEDYTQFRTGTTEGITILKGKEDIWDITKYQNSTFLEGPRIYLHQGRGHNIQLFQPEGTKSLCVLTNKNLTLENYLKIIELWLQIYKRDHQNYDDKGERLVHALLEDDLEKVNKIFDEVFSSEEAQKRELEIFRQEFSSNRDSQINKLEQQVQTCRDNIMTYQNAITEQATRIRSITEEIRTAKSLKDDEEYVTLFKYLKKNPYIKDFKFNQNRELVLDYEAPLTYFSDAPAEKYINNQYVRTQKKNIALMIINRRFELYTRCRILFDPRTFGVRAEFKGNGMVFLQHPHIDRFNCFGNHIAAISEAAESGNYLGAIEQISQAVLNLNFYDGCVIDEMMINITNNLSSHSTWLDTTTGEFVTTKEALERSGYSDEETESND